MNNFDKLAKFQERVKELFEQKYTKEDWENNAKGTRPYFVKCQRIATEEMFNKK